MKMVFVAVCLERTKFKSLWLKRGARNITVQNKIQMGAFLIHLSSIWIMEV